MIGLLAALFGTGCKPAASSQKAQQTGAQAMAELRSMMLTISASKAGVQPSETFPKAFGVLMDMPISGGHTATVVSMSDGHASLYTTSTFGVLGGIGHGSVRIAATNFVRAAQKHYESAAVAAEFPYPVPKHVRFYIVGFDGVRMVDSSIDSAENGTSKLSELWVAGQQVLTELRLVADKSSQ